MDYGGLVKRALDVMWKFKYLWIFGFFLEFGSGGGSWFFNLPEKIKLPVGDFIRYDFLEGVLVGAIVLLVMAALVIFLVFLIMYIISQGGLVHSVWRVSTGGNPALRDGWDAGLRNFWRVLGIKVIIIIFILGSILITLAPFVLILIAFKLMGVISGLILFPLLLVLIVVIALVDLYGTRACVIEGKGVFDSLGAGWNMLKSNPGPSLIVALIGIGSTLVYIFAFVAVGLLLVLPFVAVAAFNLFFGIVAGILVGLLYIGVVSALWGTYIDSLWTLAYLDMKKLQPQKAAV
ncbi:MAG: hypothetical protein GTO24_10115 [candidate division Zixibacteria bacterium]|nr:hypothetical protein [candidate division Zixibacteria bacterium]